MAPKAEDPLVLGLTVFCDGGHTTILAFHA